MYKPPCYPGCISLPVTRVGIPAMLPWWVIPVMLPWWLSPCVQRWVVGIPPCVQRWVVGIPVYVPGCTWWVYTPGYMGLVYTLGYTSHTWWYHSDYTAVHSDEARRPWAQPWEYPWVGGLCASPSPSSCVERAVMLRIVTPLFLERIMKDWIVSGKPSVNPYW